jgi:hypothetical protein
MKEALKVLFLSIHSSSSLWRQLETITVMPRRTSNAKAISQEQIKKGKPLLHILETK